MLTDDDCISASVIKSALLTIPCVTFRASDFKLQIILLSLAQLKFSNFISQTFINDVNSTISVYCTFRDNSSVFHFPMWNFSHKNFGSFNTGLCKCVLFCFCCGNLLLGVFLGVEETRKNFNVFPLTQTRAHRERKYSFCSLFFPNRKSIFFGGEFNLSFSALFCLFSSALFSSRTDLV